MKNPLRAPLNLAQRLLLSLNVFNLLAPPADAFPRPMPRFAGQHTNPKRNEERKQCRALGRRQFVKMRKYQAATGG